MVLVVLVGTALAFTAITLKPRQQANADADKMRQILASVNIYPEKDRIIEDYNKYITDSYIVDSEGNRVDDGTEAFSVNVAAESKTDAAERLLPVYVCTLGDGSQKYILPMYGAGLWGPIWGYMSVDADGSTVYGTYFAHQGETPGLGAEIEKPAFQKQFVGKDVFSTDGQFQSVKVVKNGQEPATGAWVHAISGGTITSQGVQKMLLNSLEPYSAFLAALKSDNK